VASRKRRASPGNAVIAGVIVIGIWYINARHLRKPPIMNRADVFEGKEFNVGVGHQRKTCPAAKPGTY
jgi:hypothetical protein